MSNVVRSAASFIFGKLLPKVSYPVIKGPLKGIRFILGTHGGSGGGATVYFNMIEPLQTQAFLKIIKKGDTIFDVGANVGYYTALGSRLTGKKGKVYSFEPLARNISYLYQHVEINKLANVTIVPCACFNSLSVLKFIESTNTAMGRLENGEIPGFPDLKIGVVPTVTLDAITDKIETFPHVIKIDVEGAELAVLKGAEKIISISKPSIFLSVHSPELRTSCLNYLKGYNYRFEALQDDGLNSMEFLCLPNNI